MMTQPISEKNVKLMRLMSRAVNEELLIPDYHPVLQVATPKHKTYLMHCSLTTDTGQLIPFSSLRTLSKMTEMSVALDRWLMQAALQSLKEMHHTHPEARIIVPQSIRSLNNPEYPRWLERQSTMENVSTRGLIIAFRLPHIVKDLKAAKYCFASLHRIGLDTMIDAFTNHPAAAKILRAMGSRYVSAATKMRNASDDRVETLISNCRKQGVLIMVSNISSAHDINLGWSAGADLLEGSYIHPPTKDTGYRFPSVIV